jgi:hypothetical protein
MLNYQRVMLSLAWLVQILPLTAKDIAVPNTWEL